MPVILNQQPFRSSYNHETKTAVITMSSGTAKLQACAGNDPDNDTWVDVPDSSVSASTVYTFYISSGLYYRWVLTGDAEVYQGD